MIFMSVCLFWGKYNNKISLGFKALFQLGSVAQSCPALYDPMDCGMPGFPGHHQLPELAQTHVHPTIHFILCCPLVLLPSVFPSIRVFSNESVLHIRWPKYWSFSFSTSPSNEYSRLISFRIDWFDLLAAQGTLKSLLQHHSSKHQFFTPQFSLWSNSHIYPYMTTGKTIALTRWIFVSKVMSLLFNTLSRFVTAFLPGSKCLNFMAAVTVVILEPKKIYLSLLPIPPLLFAMKWWTRYYDLSFFDCWILSQLFHSPLSLSSSRGSLVPLCFLP